MSYNGSSNFKFMGIGAKIKVERQRRKLTQHALRALVLNRTQFEVSQQLLSKIESGGIIDPERSPAISKILKTLGLDEKGERVSHSAHESVSQHPDKNFILVNGEPAFASVASKEIGGRLKKNISLWAKGGLKGLAAEMHVSPGYVQQMIDGGGSLASWALASQIMKVPMDYLVLGKQPGIPEELADILRPLVGRKL